MTLRRYVAWPDKRLRSPAAPIEAVTDEIRTLWDDMIETIDASAVLHPYEEASPNLPGFSAVIRRPRGVKVRFLDETGAEVERDFVGLEAVSVQHQIDHLAGKMYFDNLSKTKRDMLLRKARKQNG
jgi:peptide deformylase